MHNKELGKSFLVDSLTYLDPEWVGDSTLARGVLVGLVSGLMSQGHSFEEAIRILKLIAVEKNIKVDLNRIPDAWREDWSRVGIEDGEKDRE